MGKEDKLEGKLEGYREFQKKLLEMDLISFLKENNLWYGQDKGIVNSSLRKLLISLYGNSYQGKQFKKVVDIYSLTQEDMSNLAYKNHCPCGPRTLNRLNAILQKNNLPTLQTHEAHTFPARIY